MPKKKDIDKFGKIKVCVNRNCYILRFTYLGKRYSLSFGRAAPEVLKIAQAKAQEINSDILLERFDPTLAKYSARIRHKFEEAKQQPSQLLNLRELWQRYKEANRPRMSLSTILTTWKKVDYCLDKLSDKAIEFDNADLLVSELLVFYSIGTLEKAFTQIKAMGNWAIRGKLLTVNPYQDLKRQLPKRAKKSINARTMGAFTSEEVEAIIKAFAENTFITDQSKQLHSHYTSYVRFLALTGCRPEEAIALTWDDIQVRHGKTMILIEKAYTYGKLNQCTKTKISRVFPCNQQLIDLLESIPKMPNAHNLIFPNPHGEFINQENFNRRYWQKVVKGLVGQGKVDKYLPTYNLRHSFITRLIREGFDPATIASLVGTSTSMIVVHYLAPNRDIQLPEL